MLELTFPVPNAGEVCCRFYYGQIENLLCDANENYSLLSFRPLNTGEQYFYVFSKHKIPPLLDKFNNDVDPHVSYIHTYLKSLAEKLNIDVAYTRIPYSLMLDEWFSCYISQFLLHPSLPVIIFMNSGYKRDSSRISFELSVCDLRTGDYKHIPAYSTGWLYNPLIFPVIKNNDLYFVDFSSNDLSIHHINMDEILSGLFRCNSEVVYKALSFPYSPSEYHSLLLRRDYLYGSGGDSISIRKVPETGRSKKLVRTNYNSYFSFDSNLKYIFFNDENKRKVLFENVGGTWEKKQLPLWFLKSNYLLSFSDQKIIPWKLLRVTGDILLFELYEPLFELSSVRPKFVVSYHLCLNDFPIFKKYSHYNFLRSIFFSGTSTPVFEFLRFHLTGYYSYDPLRPCYFYVPRYFVKTSFGLKLVRNHNILCRDVADSYPKEENPGSKVKMVFPSSMLFFNPVINYSEVPYINVKCNLDVHCEQICIAGKEGTV